MRWQVFCAVAAALALGGCGASGGDRDAVERGLESLGSEWSVRGVELSSTDSEGLVDAVYASVDHNGPVGRDEVLDAIEAALSEVDHSAQWSLELHIATDGDSADIEAICDEFEEAGDLGPSCRRGLMNTNVFEFGAVLDEYR